MIHALVMTKTPGRRKYHDILGEVIHRATGDQMLDHMWLLVTYPPCVLSNKAT